MKLVFTKSLLETHSDCLILGLEENQKTNSILKL